MTTDDDDKLDILKAAKTRIERTMAVESIGRARFAADLRFAEADSDNMDQWPENMRMGRNDKPCLTLNVTRQHIKQVANQGRLSRTQMQVIATGGGATKEVADAFQLLFRRIEYNSQAQLAYDIARNYQVKCGLGYIRLKTQYEQDDTFDQEIFIEAIEDPMSVFMDRASVLPHGGDSNWGIVRDMVDRDVFEARYPNHRQLLQSANAQPLLTELPGSLEDMVEVLEMHWREPSADQLLSYLDPETGEAMVIRESQVPRGVRKDLSKLDSFKSRRIVTYKVRSALIVGNQVADQTDWVGTTVPLVRFVGERVRIDGNLDYKGITRHMKDAQRMYNYNASGQVEHVALQTKVPFYGPAEAFAGHEEIWLEAPNVNHPYLPYNHVDEDGNQIPPPQRMQPPQSSQAFEAGMQTAFQQTMMVTGQWQGQMGMAGNERTGAALQQRQEQSDVATYEFKDNEDQAKAWLAHMVVEIIPKVYDTQRVYRVLKENHEELDVFIDPTMANAYQRRQVADNQVAQIVINPRVGKYQVQAAAGNATATQREQTVTILGQFLTQAPALTGLIGDLLVDAFDFPAAREAAARLRRMVPPEAMGEGPSQKEKLLTQQVQSLQASLSEAMQNQAKLQLKYEGREQLRQIDVYSAETDRIKALGQMIGLRNDVIQMILDQLKSDTSQTSLSGVQESAQSAIDSDSGMGGPNAPGGGDASSGFPDQPHPDAQQADDGKWYIRNPTQMRGFLRLEPLATLHPEGDTR